MSSGWKYRTGLKLFNLGITLKLHWLQRLGDILKKSGLQEFI